MSDVAGMLYCERKAYYDATHGKLSTPESDRAARAGEAMHQRFAADGQRLLSRQDRRCFIATAVYGEDAPQTEALRRWRDRALMRHPAGRAVTAVYYRLSPPAAALVARCPALSRVARAVLDALLRHIDRYGSPP